MVMDDDDMGMGMMMMMIQSNYCFREFPKITIATTLGLDLTLAFRQLEAFKAVTEEERKSLTHSKLSSSAAPLMLMMMMPP